MRRRADRARQARRLSWQDLGLGAGTWARGASWAAAEIATVAVVFAVGAALPATRNAFRDSRYHLGWGGALLTAFVLVPVGTVVLEEVAFRGVVLPSLSLSTDNAAVGDAVGHRQSADLISVLGTVTFTALTGVLFCELRRRGDSLLAPAGLHWATNAPGVLAAAAVWAWGTR